MISTLNAEPTIRSCFAAFINKILNFEQSGRSFNISGDPNCSMENMFKSATSCPVGWFGNPGEDFCFKVVTAEADNEEAARLPFCPSSHTSGQSYNSYDRNLRL